MRKVMSDLDMTDAALVNKPYSIGIELGAHDETLAAGRVGTGFVVPDWMDGYTITALRAGQAVAGTTGTLAVTVYRVRSFSAVNVLSANITLDYNQQSVADGTINTANDDLATGDVLYAEVVSTTSDAMGGTLTLTVEKVG